METQLRAFLDSHRVKKGEPFTNTTRSPNGVYYIGEDKYENFITIYCNAVRKGLRPTVTEKPGAYGPLRVDFDFRSTLEVGCTRQYTPEILKKIVKMHQDELRNAVPKENFSDELLTCIVLEKKKPRVEEGKVKDGFHLHFPNFSCEGWFQDEYLRARINALMIESKIWDRLSFIEPVDKFIDHGMAKKVWLMYGSSKAHGGEPFLVTKVYDANLDEISLSDVFAAKLVGRKLPVEYYLPRFMSLRGYLTIVPLTDEINMRKSSYGGKRSKRAIIPKKRSMADVLKDIKTIKDGEIMSMLSDERSDDYSAWMDVGWTLFNMGQGCDEALELWIEFSKRSEKYVEGDCEERWGRMEIRDKTIGSLLAMAKSDSPDKYKEWKDTNVRTFLYQSLCEDKPNEYDVGKVFEKMYKDRFVCADGKKDLWFEFQNHRWQKMDNGVSIKLLLATEMVDLYWNFKSDLAATQKNTDEASRAKTEKQMSKCLKIITGLKSVVFQNHVIHMLEAIMYDPKFMSKLDENKMLWVCENGVLDLELGIFRDGRPDDYMMFSCNLPYHNFVKDDDEYIELKDFFRKVFVNKNRRRYFKDTACAAMEGGNINKTFIVGTGGGDNAKTITYTLLETTFGEYCIKFPRELLVVGKSNSSSSARPELSRVRGRRLAIAQELAKNETLNIGVLKELTGNDSFFSRGLYEKGTEIKPVFTLMMACNEPPTVPGHDDATWNRIRILDYESRFIKPQDLQKWPVPASVEEQFKLKRFKADLSFKSRLPDMAPVMLSMLFNRYKKYKKRGLREPAEVQMSTNTYRAVNDVHLQFIQDRIEHISYPKDTPDKEKEFLRLPDLYAEFMSWYSENHSSYAKEKINKISLMHEYNKRFTGASKQGRTHGWYGYRIVADEPEDDKQKQLHDILSGKAAAKSVTVAKKVEVKGKVDAKEEEPDEKLVTVKKISKSATVAKKGATAAKKSKA